MARCALPAAAAAQARASALVSSPMGPSLAFWNSSSAFW